MANKYTYSRMIVTNEGSEKFTFEGAASFDEAKKEVDKGVRDRLLELAEGAKQAPPVIRVSGSGGYQTPPPAATTTGPVPPLVDNPLSNNAGSA